MLILIIHFIKKIKVIKNKIYVYVYVYLFIHIFNFLIK
jgi:hypothetical protein